MEKNISAHRSIIIGVLAIVLIGVISAVFLRSSRGVPKPKPYAGPMEKIIIGNIGEYSLFNLIAKEQGFFTANGLDAEVREYDAGPSTMRALIDGDVDVAVAADFVGVRNFFQHPEVRILTQGGKHKAFYVLGRKDKGIHAPEDLKGKKIAVTKGSAGEFYLRRFLILHDLEFSDVIAVDSSPESIITQLTEGTIDAGVIFDPHAYRLIGTLGDALVSWLAQGDQNTFTVTYVMQDMVEKRPGLIDRYVRALVEAEAYLKAHASESRELLASLLGYDHEYVGHMLEHFSFTHRLDQELLITMEDQARFIIANDPSIRSGLPNYLEYIYFDALSRVRPDAITIIR